MKTKDLTIIAIFSAVMCVLSPLSIPLAGGVPISLATFVVMLIAAVLGEKKGTLAVLIYIVLGFAGLPVFSNFRGGAGVVMGMTGGYIIGYLPLAYITGLFFRLYKDNICLKALGMVLGTVVLYTVGTIWFINITGMNLAGAMSACVIPFIPGDIIKMVVVALSAPQINSRIKL